MYMNVPNRFHILRHHGIDYHIYAQLYIKFDLSDPSIALEKINLCISDIRTWMIKNSEKSLTIFTYLTGLDKEESYLQNCILCMSMIFQII